MTNDIVKIKSVAASQGGETEHGLMLDSSILSYTYQGSSKTVKWILDTIFTLLGGKAASATTLAGYGITDAYTKTQVDTALDGKVSKNEIKGITFHNIDTSTTINPADIADGFIHQLNNALGRTLSSILGGSGYIHYHQNAGSLTDTAICVRVYAGTAPHYIVEIACAYTM